LYLSFYGLRESPFELTSDPEFLFYTAQHREAFANLEYGLSCARAMTLLIGEAGTGKTTLLRAALKSESCRGIQPIFIHNTTLTRNEFIETIANQFQLVSAAARSKTSLLNVLEPLLRDRRARGESVALVVDEAQSLTDELLEEIRLLANIETDKEKLLPVVLVAQPQLAVRLNEPSRQQLKQRIALRCQIGPLSLDDTAAYMASRLRKAGGETARLFTRDAVILIYERSRGIPRTINVICENALLNGSILGKQPVDRQTVAQVCLDFDLSTKTASLDAVRPFHAQQNLARERTRVVPGFNGALRRRGLLAMLGIG
jgi:general secretion pathway protein A